MGVTVSVRVNGRPVTADVDAGTLLVEFIRDHQRLTGTHIGCDTAQCGACTVHVDGRAVKACNVLLSQAVTSQVSSALQGLTSVFGMGTGGPPASSTPTI